jgi:hypothetical protein
MIKLELSLAEVNLILTALAERPLREVADIFGKVQREANDQLRAEQEKKNVPNTSGVEPK